MSKSKLKIEKGPNYISAIATDMVFSLTPSNIPTIALSFQYGTTDVVSATLVDSDKPNQKHIKFDDEDTVSFREIICKIDVPVPVLKDACIKILAQIAEIETAKENSVELRKLTNE